MSRTPSLGWRLLLISALAAMLFLGLTGLALDQAYRSSQVEAARERLQGHVYTLLAAARLEDGVLTIPGGLPEARFHQPGGGLYGRIRDGRGNPLWRSDSAVGLDWSAGAAPEPGVLFHSRLELNREPVRVLSYGLHWEEPDSDSGTFIVDVAETRLEGQRQLGAFRQTLWGWLGVAAAAMLLTQALLQRWGLAPLRRAVRELQEVRRGRQERLRDRYPRELLPLTESINRLLRAERRRRQAVQHGLADLAHGLKTPLAVLRSALDAVADTEVQQQAREQIERMDASVRYQLARAGRSQERMGQQTPIRPVAERLLRTVPALRQPLPELVLECPDELCFPGPEEELLELLGNLVENAARYCRGRIHVTVAMEGDETGLRLEVADDGPGIPAACRDRVLLRGERADERQPGNGIGLAIVRDLAEAYGGRLTIDEGPLQGTRITLGIPLPA